MHFVIGSYYQSHQWLPHNIFTAMEIQSGFSVFRQFSMSRRLFLQYTGLYYRPCETTRAMESMLHKVLAISSNLTLDR